MRRDYYPSSSDQKRNKSKHDNSSPHSTTTTTKRQPTPASPSLSSPDHLHPTDPVSLRKSLRNILPAGSFSNQTLSSPCDDGKDRSKTKRKKKINNRFVTGSSSPSISSSSSFPAASSLLYTSSLLQNDRDSGGKSEGGGGKGVNDDETPSRNKGPLISPSPLPNDHSSSFHPEARKLMAQQRMSEYEQRVRGNTLKLIDRYQLHRSNQQQKPSVFSPTQKTEPTSTSYHQNSLSTAPFTPIQVGKAKIGPGKRDRGRGMEREGGKQRGEIGPGREKGRKGERKKIAVGGVRRTAKSSLSSSSSLSSRPLLYTPSMSLLRTADSVAHAPRSRVQSRRREKR